jgi:rubredoxin
MKKKIKFILQPFNGLKSRETCPSCKKENQFTTYIDEETNEPLNNRVGLCNRAINCGYHYTPKQYFESNPESK